MNETIRITEMKITDYDEVYALWRETDEVGLHEVDSREAIARFLARNPSMCSVARDGDRLVGVVLCGTDGRMGILSRVAVAAGHRRGGVGTAMIQRCLAVLAAEGITRCNLYVYGDNAQALAFWGKLGWQSWDARGIRTLSLKME